MRRFGHGGGAGATFLRRESGSAGGASGERGVSDGGGRWERKESGERVRERETGGSGVRVERRRRGERGGRDERGRERKRILSYRLDRKSVDS